MRPRSAESFKEFLNREWTRKNANDGEKIVDSGTKIAAESDFFILFPIQNPKLTQCRLTAFRPTGTSLRSCPKRLQAFAVFQNFSLPPLPH
jgi:hypothetical protein